jgi:hypothetical protein
MMSHAGMSLKVLGLGCQAQLWPHAELQRAWSFSGAEMPVLQCPRIFGHHWGLASLELGTHNG